MCTKRAGLCRKGGTNTQTSHALDKYMEEENQPAIPALNQYDKGKHPWFGIKIVILLPHKVGGRCKHNSNEEFQL